MEFYWQPTWPEIIAKQEETLLYETFTREMALELGLKILELAKAEYKQSASIQILEDGVVIFAYKMPGTDAENDWWMGKKLAVSLQTGTSSLRAYVEGKAGLRKPFWEARPENYAACGGCFPVIMENGEIFARILVSSSSRVTSFRSRASQSPLLMRL